MELNCDKVRNVKQCIEIATTDAHDEDEAASGWHACFEDVFDGIEEVKLWDETVKLSGFGFSKNAVVAIVEKKKKKIKVTLDSIQPIKPTKVHLLWLKAWQEWQKGY